MFEQEQKAHPLSMKHNAGKYLRSYYAQTYFNDRYAIVDAI